MLRRVVVLVIAAGAAIATSASAQVGSAGSGSGSAEDTSLPRVHVRIAVHVAAAAAGEPAIAGAVVALGDAVTAVTDAHGDAVLDGDATVDDVIWLRVPEGYEPGAVWAPIPHAGARVQLRARPRAAAATGAATGAAIDAPIDIVIASDTHVGSAQLFSHDLADAARAATLAGDPPPAMFAILGDITQGGGDDEFALVRAQLADLGVPVVAVQGNHDAYDGGATWRARLGPAHYSFDLGGVHFVVCDLSLPADDVREQLAADLRRVGDGIPIVALAHVPPAPAVVDVLRELGVGTVLDGHLHGNRVNDLGGVRELTTEPLLMGGLDVTPAGYRVVTIVRGALAARHRVTVDRPSAAIVSPAPGQCVPARAAFEVVAAAAIDSGTLSASATVDGALVIALAPSGSGGLDLRGMLPSLEVGRHQLAIDARSTTGATAHVAHTFDVCAPPVVTAADPTAAPWSQLGGGAAHLGAIDRELAPPLVPRWAVSVGEHIITAAPAIAGGIVYVVTTDLADGNRGGVVALDLATGRERWRVASDVPLRGGAALVGPIAIITRTDGVVVALDAATGRERWRTDVSEATPPEGAMLAGAAVSDSDVVVGSQRALAALDARTGTRWWSVPSVRTADTWIDFATIAPVAIADGLVVGTFAREHSGLGAWDLATGELAWRVDLYSDIQPAAPVVDIALFAVGIEAAPVIDTSTRTVFAATSNDEVAAIDLDTGFVRWRVQLDRDAFPWANAIVGAPAYAHGVVVVPTLLDAAVALDAATGAELWRVPAHAASAVRVTHYRGRGAAGFAAAPVITGDIVWLADTSGTLVARALATGGELWRTELDVPVLAGLAVADDTLVIASFDGSVRALSPVVRAPAKAAPAKASGGGCDTGDADGGWLLAVIALTHATASRIARRRRLAPRPHDPRYRGHR